ncbi:MAG: hypothetical protein K2X11_03665 [Acetobacteraceae bacterium]|nr:hypothetical protein [Acetobacteraceae bacterium]
MTRPEPRRRRPPGFDEKLLRLAEEVADDYLAFLGRDNQEEAKDFAARQNAGKAALAHIEALLKLADTGEEEAHRRMDEKLALFTQARQEIGEDDDGTAPG